LRVDKLTLAALEATLRGPRPPVADALHADDSALRARAERVADELAAAGLEVAVVPSVGLVGGGGAPGVELLGWAISLAASYAEALRRGEPCVVGRVERDRCLLDLRCVPADRDGDVTKAVLAV
jgi:L-seryl-tRNA(Ser) seleniumtransferase